MKKKFFYLIMFAIVNSLLFSVDSIDVSECTIDELNTLIEQASDNKVLAQLYTERAIKYDAGQEFQKANEDLEKALALFPLVITYEVKASVAYGTEDYKTCIEALMQIKPHIENDAYWNTILATSYYHSGQYENAIQPFSVAINNSSPDYNLYICRGLCYFYVSFGKKDTDYLLSARSDCLQAVSLKTDDILANLLLGCCAYYLEENESTIYFVSKAVRLAPVKCAVSFFMIASAYYNLQKFDLAEKNINDYFRYISPKFRVKISDAYILKAFLLLRRNEFTQAEKEINTAITIKAETASYYLARAYLYSKMYQNTRHKEEKYLKLCEQDLYKYRELGEEIEIEALLKNKDRVGEELEKVIDKVFTKPKPEIFLTPL